MDKTNTSVQAETLSEWLREGKPVFILDVRPKEQRAEWQIPGSVYLDAYKRLNAGDTSVLDEINIPKGIPVVTVCAAGRTSQIAADELRLKGIEAYSLEGGMKGWTLAWNIAKISDAGVDIIQVRRTGKGCLSYIIISKGEAIVIDASVEPGVYTQLLQEHNATLKYVLETHIHADHLSRSKVLSDTNNVPLYLPASNKAAFSFTPVTGGTILTVGDTSIEAISTPGHTLESCSYLAGNKFLFTGDTLFTNGVVRPDLKAGADETVHKARMLYQSLQHLLALDGNTVVLPAHTSQPVAYDGRMIQATLNEVKRDVPLLHNNEQEFVAALLQRIPDTPANYLAIAEKNVKGDFSDVNPADLEAGANRCAIS